MLYYFSSRSSTHCDCSAKHRRLTNVQRSCHAGRHEMISFRSRLRAWFLFQTARFHPYFRGIIQSFLRPRRPTKSYKLPPRVWICWIKCSDIHKVCDLGSAGGLGMFYFLLFSGPFRNLRYTGLTLQSNTLQYKKQLFPRYFWASFWG